MLELCLHFLPPTLFAQAVRPPVAVKAAKSVSYKIFSCPRNTWGYDLFVDGRLLVHQPTPPGIAGNEGFKTKAAAQRIAALAASKVRKGQIPPTITLEEMKSRKAI